MPAEKRAACLPERRPRRRPRSRRAAPTASSMKRWKMPIALEPPPTQAQHDVGQPADEVEHLLARLDADDAVEVADHLGERVRAGHGAEDVVRRRDVGDPVAQRLVDGVLERLAAVVDGHDLGAEQPHPGDVEGLALGVLAPM